MDESGIKNAQEIIQERLARLGEASEDDKLRWKYIPEGRTLGVKYLSENNIDLTSEMLKFTPDAIKYVSKGLEEVLLSSISLPVNDTARRKSEKATTGLKLIKKNKAAVDRILAKIKYVFDHYATTGNEQKKQIYERLKDEFRRKLKQGLSQANIAADVDFDVEKLPQFQDEWWRAEARVDGEYLKLLDDYKKELEKVI